MNDKVKKIIVVVFLTLFIWAWAFNALEQETTEPVALSVSATVNPDFLVTFTDRESPVNMSVTLKGPASKIKSLKKELNAGTVQLAYSLNVRSEEMDKPIHYSWDVLEFLTKNIKMPGISVSTCSIKSMGVDVEQLVKRSLDVQVVDENDIPQEHKDIKPAKVEMFVRKGTPDTLKATVRLSPDQIKRARMDYVVEPAFILVGDETRISSRVKVMLPPTEQALLPRVYNPTIGVINSIYQHGRYTVEITNESKLSTIHFLATEKAWNAYKKMRYHILIEIDEDALNEQNEQGEIFRPIMYNFPQEYVELNEIKAVTKPQTARFTLTPVAKK